MQNPSTRQSDDLPLPKGIDRRRALPDPELGALWDSIIVDERLKRQLLSQAVLNFTVRAKVPRSVLPLHGVILLVGPPGTGKTSLARGLGHRTAESFTGTPFQLLEVEPHQLTSSALGKTQRAVSDLFAQSILESASAGPTIVLLDEVETLAADRHRQRHVEGQERLRGLRRAVQNGERADRHRALHEPLWRLEFEQFVHGQQRKVIALSDRLNPLIVLQPCEVHHGQRAARREVVWPGVPRLDQLLIQRRGRYPAFRVGVDAAPTACDLVGAVSVQRVACAPGYELGLALGAGVAAGHHQLEPPVVVLELGDLEPPQDDLQPFGV